MSLHFVTKVCFVSHYKKKKGAAGHGHQNVGDGHVLDLAQGQKPPAREDPAQDPVSGHDQNQGKGQHQGQRGHDPGIFPDLIRTTLKGFRLNIPNHGIPNHDNHGKYILAGATHPGLLYCYKCILILLYC